MRRASRQEDALSQAVRVRRVFVCWGNGPVSGGRQSLSRAERKGRVSEPWSCELGSMWRWEW